MKKKHLLPISIIAFFLVSTFSTSCINDAEEQTAIFEHTVDTTYQRRVKILNKELDSICAMQKDSLVRSNIDSIKQVRLKEIEKLK
ncbi:MAG TPA: hypothetical protein ENJ53_00050 [Phaeodactylibacter sp.]|nr:hypothetical protein [Phaeodactylibacter sp.]